MTQQEWLNLAKPVITIMIDGVPITGTLKKFSTGSVGYNANGKIVLNLQDGRPLKYQLSLNLIATGSREWQRQDCS